MNQYWIQYRAKIGEEMIEGEIAVTAPNPISSPQDLAGIAGTIAGKIDMDNGLERGTATVWVKAWQRFEAPLLILPPGAAVQ